MGDDLIDLSKDTSGEAFSFAYSFDNSGGVTVFSANIDSFHPEGAYLPDVLEQFRRFLIAAGFDYVSTVMVTTTGGESYTTE
jgi:hypothetical protein